MKESFHWQNNLSHQAVLNRREKAKKASAETKEKGEPLLNEKAPPPQEDPAEVTAEEKEPTKTHETPTPSPEGEPSKKEPIKNPSGHGTGSGGGGHENSSHGDGGKDHSHGGGHHGHGGSFVKGAAGLLSQILLMPVGIALSGFSTGWNMFLDVCGKMIEPFTGKGGGGGEAPKKSSGGGHGHDDHH